MAMKPAMSEKLARLFKMVQEHPDQTVADYQALTNAEDEAAGIEGRTFAVGAGMTKLYQDGYVSRYKNEGEKAMRFKEKLRGKARIAAEVAAPAPSTEAKKASHKAKKFTLNLCYTLELPSGTVSLTRAEALELFETLRKEFE
jgi:hypothetical protein